MIPNMPTIGIRFDIGKAESGGYGHTCWKVFWQAIDPDKIPAASLYEGDTAATLNGREHVFCITVQSIDAEAVTRVKTALTGSQAIKEVAATPMFVEGSACTSEPLRDAGRIDARGNLVGNAGASRSALGAVKKERQTARPATDSGGTKLKASKRVWTKRLFWGYLVAGFLLRLPDVAAPAATHGAAVGYSLATSLAFDALHGALVGLIVDLARLLPQSQRAQQAALAVAFSIGALLAIAGAVSSGGHPMSVPSVDTQNRPVVDT